MKAIWQGATLAAALLLGIAPAVAEAPRVVVTIKPIHALVANVMDGVAVPELLVKGQASPHTYALKPSESRSLFVADAIFRVSDTIEPFTTKIKAALPATAAMISLASAPDLTRLPRRTGTTFEDHDHDHDHGRHHTDEKDKDQAGASDGHVWLDPENARAMARYIDTVLGKRFPPHAARFRKNREALEARLQDLDQELAALTAPLKGKPFAVYHDAFQYFEHRYGLKAVGSIFIAQDIAPGAKRLTDLRKQIAKLNAVCIFSEPQSDPRMLQAIIEGGTARTGVLDAEGLALEPGPDLYFELMRGLAKGLRTCLAPDA
jgi:zinc transport system substrate-binding protein